MSKFTIFHNTDASKYSGCDEVLQTIEVESIQEALRWTDLWCGRFSVTKVVGVDGAYENTINGWKEMEWWN